MKARSGPSIFPLHHGRPALWFVGTVGDRGSDRHERVPSPTALAQWLVAAQLAAEPTAPSMHIYRAALNLREAIARAVSTIVAGNSPALDDIASINAAMRRWNSRPSLDPATLTIVDGLRDPVLSALGRVARDAIELLGSPAERARLRICGSPQCGSIFLTPVGHDRRWCSMARCGNRAKVAAFRARHSDTQ